MVQPNTLFTTFGPATETEPSSSTGGPSSHPPTFTSTRMQDPQRMRISTTQTVTVAPTETAAIQPTLRLRGAGEGEMERTESGRRIQWAEDVVDNEGLGRKSSKVCCIYHAPKQSIDDSSSDSSSSDDSDSSNEDAGPRRIGGGGPGKKRGRGHKHDKDFGHGKGDKRPSPNAYEKMPRYKPKGGAGSGGEIKGPQ